MEIRDLFDELTAESGDVLPLELQRLLREPLDVCEDWQRAEDLLLKARALLPNRIEVLVALYKMYAYSNRHDESLQLIDEALAMAAVQAGIEADWRQLDSHSTEWNPASGALRLYLYSMKARGFVLLRKTQVADAWEVLSKLMLLDADDQVGGRVVYEMAERLREDEMEDAA